MYPYIIIFLIFIFLSQLFIKKLLSLQRKYRHKCVVMYEK